jgi:hypothetical protein
MVKMFDNPKRAFLESFFLALVIFVLGIFLGISFEDSRLNEINEYYALSEISLIDSLALGKMSNLNTFNCSDLVKNNIDFADKIYEEALLLEKYEQSGDLTESLKIAHRKYDVLRTLLWINVIDTKEKCKKNISSVVYLYEHESEEIGEKANQVVWARILFDLKQKYSDKILLIPISVNSDVSSLDLMTRKLGISKYPAVVINEKIVLYDLTSLENLEKYLK